MAETDRERLLARLEELPSVGPVLAKRIYENMNPSTLNDVESLADDGSLTNVKGIGPSRCERIARSFRDRSDNGATDDGLTISRSHRVRFIEKLRCPDCPGGSLIEGDLSFRCSGCGSCYHEYRDIVDFSGGATNQTALDPVEGNSKDSSPPSPYFRYYLRSLLNRLLSGRSRGPSDDLVSRYMEIKPDAEVLDFGCRTGDYTCRFARSIRVDSTASQGLAVGVDVLWSMLERARLSAQRAGLTSWIHYARTDTNNLPFKDNSFTHVHTSGILHLIEDIQGATQSFARVLKPGGVLVIGTYLLGGGIVRPFVKWASEVLSDVHWFTREELYDVLSRTGFEVDSESQREDYLTVRAKRI